MTLVTVSLIPKSKLCVGLSMQRLETIMMIFEVKRAILECSSEDRDGFHNWHKFGHNCEEDIGDKGSPIEIANEGIWALPK